MKIIALFFVLLSVSAQSAAIDSVKAKFHPKPGVTAEVIASKYQLNYTLTFSNFHKTLNTPLEIETRPHIEIEDFNFDGYKDFSIWYLDGGMGKYTIHRIFIFDSLISNFVEAVPRCGGEFLNLQINKSRKFLAGTYYKHNRPVTCITRFKGVSKIEGSSNGAGAANAGTLAIYDDKKIPIILRCVDILKGRR